MPSSHPLVLFKTWCRTTATTWLFVRKKGFTPRRDSTPGRRERASTGRAERGVEEANMPFDAHTLKKAARLEQSSWQLSCKADFTECFGELTVYVALVLCMIGAAGLFWRMCCRRRRSTYHKVLLGSDDSSRPADLEEGWAAASGIVDMENFGSDKPNRRRPGHQRNTSQGSMLSLDPLEDDDDDGFDVDDYASLDALEMLRKLSHEVVVKVKEVVPEMSEVQAAVHVAGHVAKLSVQTVVKPPSSASRPPRPPLAALSPVYEAAEHAASDAAVPIDVPASVPEVTRPRSMLHKVTLAWAAARGGSGGSSDAGEVAEAGDQLRVDSLLEAFRVSLTVCESFGSLMAPAVKNDLANLEKVRTSSHAL
jgi:hypothetical protein